MAMRTPKLIVRHLPAALILAALLIAVFSQVSFDRKLNDDAKAGKRVPPSVLPESLVVPLSFGFKAAFADWYWISAVQELVGWNGSDKYYADYYFNISVLDPRFARAFQVAAFVLPSRKNPETYRWLEELSARGFRANPENWEIPFYTGVALHTIARDTKRATGHLKVAAEVPGAPELVRRTYPIYLMQEKNERDTSRALFAAVAETATNEVHRRVAIERLGLIELIEELERHALRHKEKHGEFPETVEEVTTLYRVVIPPELEKYRLNIDRNTGEVFLVR